MSKKLTPFPTRRAAQRAMEASERSLSNGTVNRTHIRYYMDSDDISSPSDALREEMYERCDSILDLRNAVPFSSFIFLFFSLLRLSDARKRSSVTRRSLGISNHSTVICLAWHMSGTVSPDLMPKKSTSRISSVPCLFPLPLFPTHRPRGKRNKTLRGRKNRLTRPIVEAKSSPEVLRSFVWLVRRTEDREQVASSRDAWRNR